MTLSKKNIRTLSYGTMALFAVLVFMSMGTVNAQTASTTSSTVPLADLSITKTVDNANPQSGASVNYAITVDNLGPATATGAIVQDTLPAGLAFNSATTSVGTYDPTSGQWTVGDLTASSSATLDVNATVIAASGTSIVNTATATESASSSDPDTANNTATATLTVATTTPETTSTLDVDVMGLSGSDQAELSVADLTTGSTTPATTGDEISPFTLNTNDAYSVTATTTASGYSVATSSDCSGTLATDTTCSVIFIPPNTVPTLASAGLTIQNTVNNPTPIPSDTVNYTLVVSALGPATSSMTVIHRRGAFP